MEARTPGPERPTGNPTLDLAEAAQHAAQAITSELPQLIRMALSGAKRGKPTVLRAVRGIIRDLQKEAATAVREDTKAQRVWSELLEAGHLTRFEADYLIRALDVLRNPPPAPAHMKQHSYAEYEERWNRDVEAGKVKPVNLIGRWPKSGPPQLLAENPMDTDAAAVSKK